MRKSIINFHTYNMAKTKSSLLKKEVIVELSDVLKAASKADLSGCNLSNCDLSHLNLAGAKLNGSDLSHSKLNGTKLQGAQLYGAHLVEAELCGAQLADANLNGADLRGADLHGADLRRCDFRNADLSDANLNGADVQGVQFEGSIGLTEDKKCSLKNRGAKFKDFDNPPDIKWWTKHVIMPLVIALLGSGGIMAWITAMPTITPAIKKVNPSQPTLLTAPQSPTNPGSASPEIPAKELIAPNSNE